MSSFIGRRFLQAVPVLLAVSLVVFLMVRSIPGNPAEILLGSGATAGQVKALTAKMGFDRPLPIQYLDFLEHAARGDLGDSITTGRPVTTELLARVPATLELTLAALLLGIGLGVPLGVLAAVKRSSFWDHLASTGALVGLSTPIFWLGMLLIMLLGVRFHLLPFPGRASPQFQVPSVTGLLLVDSLIAGNGGAWWDAFKHLIMPALTLGTVPLAVIMRMTRASMLDVLGEDYLRTARAKGVSVRRLIFKHALRNALLPMITVTGIQVGLLMGGAVITETIFSWPGVGQIAYEAINQRDYAMIEGVVLYGAAFFVMINLVADVLYAMVDPRVRWA